MSVPPRRSTAYQNAIKEATEWLETAQSSDEPTSHDLDPAHATLPRLEFVSEAQVAAASKLLDMGGAGAGGAATHARLASLPQPSFRLARCAKDSRARMSDSPTTWPPGPMAMGRGKSRELRRSRRATLGCVSLHRFVTAEVTTAAAEPECSVSSPAAVV